MSREAEAPTFRKMTLTEWAALPEEEAGELVDGILVEEEMPGLLHETVVSWLIWVLRTWIARRGGFVFGSEAKFGVAPGRGRKPDLTVYLGASSVLPRTGLVRVPPDIAVEVVSTTRRDQRRDRLEKRDDYAEFGVPYYWIVDPERRTLEILQRDDDGRYVLAFGASKGPVDSVPGCEGLAFDLDDLWAEIEKLGPEESDP